jgi:hypothetical protein
MLSYQNKWKVSKEADRIKSLYHPLLTSLLWKASVRQIGQIKKMIPPENFMLVRYEALVQNPERLVRKICRFIGENFEDDMLNINEANSSFQLGQQGIYSSSVGRWRGLLTNEEVYIAQKITKHRMLEFGYTLDELKVSPFRVGYMFATLPHGLWKALHANKPLRGPLLPYVLSRLAALCRSAVT